MVTLYYFLFPCQKYLKLRKDYNMYKQWSTPDGKSFIPVREVVKSLPPGHYTATLTMDGTPIYTKREVKTEALLKLPNSYSKRVLEDINTFWLKENIFRENQIPYKRGIILYGPPGSGKTSILKLVADDLINRDGIIIEYPNSHSFETIYECIRQVHPEKPLIFIMEDMDAIMYRDSETKLLNILDGMTQIDKVLFLATTNYPEKLGSRYMRPGRFDKRILVGMPTSEAREAYIRHKLKTEDNNLIKRWVKDTEGMSIAHIKELHIANQVLGEEYEETIQTLRKMKECPHSETFDDYTITHGKLPTRYESLERYSKYGKKDPQYKEKKETLYEDNTIIENHKLKKSNNINKIADMLTEDIQPGTTGLI
jgi:hypothetical protein